VISLTPGPDILTELGGSLSLTCRATVVDHLLVEPTILWLLPNGSHGNSSNIKTRNITRTLYESTLTLNLIQISQQGQYQCNVSINIPNSTLPTKSNVSMTDVSVRRKFYVEILEPRLVPKLEWNLPLTWSTQA